MLEFLLPDRTRLRLIGVQLLDEDGRIRARLATCQQACRCPMCGNPTEKVHCRYCRTISDLPWADLPVELQLSVRRFFCRSVTCERKVFCERLPGIVMPWARRTERLVEAHRALGTEAGGAAGSRLSRSLALEAGVDLLLDTVRRGQSREPVCPRVLGVDDWAMRKGHTYGTILIDLEAGEIVDLLPDRSAETLAARLRERDGVEIVVRDRSKTYALGITDGAPEALQVADRWHLLKNLTDAVFKIVRGRHADRLTAWLEAATNSGMRVWCSFARSIQSDLAAVEAALSQPWSNGPTAGHVNRLKCVKRQMYGRAKLDLLRLRLMAA